MIPASFWQWMQDAIRRLMGQKYTEPDPPRTSDKTGLIVLAVVVAVFILKAK